jgi:PAS domain S-box-containing protein
VAPRKPGSERAERTGAGLGPERRELEQRIADVEAVAVERRQVEAALRESEDRYRRLRDNIPGMIYNYRVDADGGHCFPYVSSASRQLFGLEPEDVMRDGALLPSLIHPEDVEKVARTMRRSGQDGTPFRMEIRHVVDGDVRWHDCISRPVVLADGVVWDGIMMDVTERRRAEIERESLIAQLEEKNLELERQNAALERYAYTVSHDLKNPLATIRLFTGALRQSVARAQTDRMEQDLERIDKAARDMHHLLEDLLQFSRVGQVREPPETVPLDELASEVLELLAEPLRAADLEVDVQPHLPPVWGDRKQLREVLQNLVENAMKFLGEQPRPRIEIGAEEHEREVRCWVADNGAGVEPRYHKKIFGLFEKLAPQIDGSGIGLALVRRIVEQHGGRVWIESDGEGKGSRFTFTIPKPAAPG